MCSAQPTHTHAQVDRKQTWTSTAQAPRVCPCHCHPHGGGHTGRLEAGLHDVGTHLLGRALVGVTAARQAQGLGLVRVGKVDAMLAGATRRARVQQDTMLSPPRNNCFSASKWKVPTLGARNANHRFATPDGYCLRCCCRAKRACSSPTFLYECIFLYQREPYSHPPWRAERRCRRRARPQRGWPGTGAPRQTPANTSGPGWSAAIGSTQGSR